MFRILVADASQACRDSYSHLFSSHGCQVQTAKDALECLTRLRHTRPDLLILDFHLPCGGGDGVLSVLDEDPHLLPDRVVITSPRASAPILDDLLAPPGIEALFRPFTATALLEQAGLVPSDGMVLPPWGSQAPGVLVVDDDPTVRYLLHAYLHAEGFRVWTAGGGEEALDFCSDHGEEIAVILLDLQMPDLDGLHTLAGIRELSATLPVCFMTGNPDHYDPDELLQRGAQHLLTKPFRLDDLLQVVRSLACESSRSWMDS